MNMTAQFPHILTSILIHPVRCRLNKWHREVGNVAKKLKKSEFSSLEELCSIQHQKLRVLCANADKGCLYYRKIFYEASLDPRQIDLNNLPRLPNLEKKIIRENFNDIINYDFPENEINKNATGGSSGEPLIFCESRQSKIQAAAFTLRGYEACGKKEGFPHVKLWGAPTDVQKTTAGLKNILWNFIYNRRTIDAFNSGPELFESEYQKFAENPPYLLESYSNILYQFALYLDKEKKRPLSIPAVISSAGVLYDFQRDVIQKMISGNIFNRYGSREFGNMAHECEAHAGMHINMERFIIEIDNPDKDGIGDILVTDLDNHAFPFIRYRIGDKGRLASGRCPCGRQSMRFSNIIGRSLDIITTKSGKMISGEMFPHFFKDYHEIIVGQVIQDAIDHIEIRLRLQEGASMDNIAPLIDKIKQVSNCELDISVNTSDDLVVNPTGKYRPVISKIISNQ